MSGPPPTNHRSGRLTVGEGHELAFEIVGDPLGLPVVHLHGGPGSGMSESARRLYDPNRFRVVFFDQRGAGRSTPHASALNCDLETITLDRTIADIERLRAHVNIERWLVAGGSWGSTVALAYAQAHPDRVAGLVLHAVATTTAREIDWITRGVGAFFPDAWEAFVAGAGCGPDGDLVEAYRRRLADPDPAVHQTAADAWCAWEQAIVAIRADHRPHPRWADPRFRLGFARQVTHAWANRGWRGPTELLDGMERLAAIPGALVHGRLDLSSPLESAWALARAWPSARLTIVGTGGHGFVDGEMLAATRSAIEEVATRIGSA